jgi:hypothetical protein
MEIKTLKEIMVESKTPYIRKEVGITSKNSIPYITLSPKEKISDVKELVMVCASRNAQKENVVFKGQKHTDLLGLSVAKIQTENGERLRFCGPPAEFVKVELD